MTAGGRLALVLAALLATACAGAEPRSSAEPWPAQTVRVGGLVFTALGGRWPGFPPDLERYYLPVEVIVRNDRREPVAVRVADFALLDAAGRERPAVRPTDATTALFGTYGRRSRLGTPGGAGVAPAATYWSFGARFGYPYYWGPYYPHPYAAYPYYAAPRVPSYTEATGDLIRYGVADGTIDAGGSLRGFLYFEPGAQVREARLRWASPGTPEPLVAPVVSAR